ncbi:integrase [Porphyromonas gulae]|uniref:site-specific integrase n=1 Tax=Porphyromonas gulae TaxID=111105 RepID=UPI00052C4F0F|nr:site-specific integrase [Porphyromonas gulae]KGO01944.1 integrase [Porphyromonas gulae]
MQREKFKVLLYLKKSGLDKSGQAPIMGRITYGRTMAQFSCKLSCDPDLWNTRESRLNGKSREAVATNGKLERLLLSVHSAYRRLCERGAVFTATDIKELFQGSMQGQTTFLERYDRLFEEMEKLVGVEIKASSLYAYRSTRKHLQRFILHQFHSSDIAFGQIGDDFLSQLEHYIKGVSGLSQGSYRRIALYSKKILRLAYQEGLIDRLLFDTVEIERGENRAPRALDKVSLEKLRALTFDAHESALETARDLFVFSCFTGVAYCDMVTLGREHLFTDDEGAWWLKFRRQKTDTLCRVKLLPEAVRLIERYQSEERITLFAPIAYSAYLAQLKALQLRAGIAVPLSAHVGRHTFATLITLERGVPIETVSRMLGHGSIKTTERYAHVTPKKLFDEFERFLSFTEDLQLSL